MAPLSCKFDQFLTVLGKSYEECSYLGTLNMANELFKPNKSEISSLLLFKMVKNWSNMHERGGPLFSNHPVKQKSASNHKSSVTKTYVNRPAQYIIYNVIHSLGGKIWRNQETREIICSLHLPTPCDIFTVRPTKGMVHLLRFLPCLLNILGQNLSWRFFQITIKIT